MLTGATLVLAASTASAFTPQQEQRLQRVVEDYREELAFPGLVVGVWQRGHGQFTTAVGRANRRTGRDMRTRDHFVIGSETKTMTATLVLQLIQRGKVGLYDPLSKYVPGVPLGRLITVRMLLNHTSGIHDGPGEHLTKIWARHPHRGFSVSRLLRWPLRAPRYGLPGQVWQYSNTGYWLLGKIARKVTHKSLGRLYKRRIFDRVGMGETSFHYQRPVPKPAAHGYIGCQRGFAACAGRPPGAAADTTDWNRSWAWSAGAITSRLNDLRRWAPAVATGRGLVNDRVQAKRLSFVPTGGNLGEAGLVGYGLGIAKWDLDPARRVPACKSETLPDETLYGHNGEFAGYSSETWYSPESKLTVVALANASVTTDPLRPERLDELSLDGLVPCLAAAVGG
jgi:D-alanyl-D-alanine carboxypeptidase